MPPSQPQPDSDEPPPGQGPPRRRAPPAARPTSPELIADLHARREWLAETRGVASSSRLYDYLAHEWYDGESREWAAADIGADAALMWRELGLQPAEAADLQREGFVPEEVSAQWRGSGIPADEIAEWIGAGLTPDEARAQRRQGVTAQDAAVMRRLRRLGGS